MLQLSFDENLWEKYGSYDTLYNGINHYETLEVKDSLDRIILQPGLKVDSNFSVTFLDDNISEYKTLTPIIPITNYQYEEKLNDAKRNIYLLKPEYIQVVRDDLEVLMTYKEGSTQYVSETLKRADNIRLFQ